MHIEYSDPSAVEDVALLVLKCCLWRFREPYEPGLQILVVPELSHGALPCTPGGPIPSGSGFAFSFFNLASVCALLCSITLLCLKYVT